MSNAEAWKDLGQRRRLFFFIWIGGFLIVVALNFSSLALGFPGIISTLGPIEMVAFLWGGYNI